MRGQHRPRQAPVIRTAMALRTLAVPMGRRRKASKERSRFLSLGDNRRILHRVDEVRIPCLCLLANCIYDIASQTTASGLENQENCPSLLILITLDMYHPSCPERIVKAMYIMVRLQKGPMVGFAAQSIAQHNLVDLTL